MKLFDEKGRIFGLINIIDLLVLVAVLGLVFVGVLKFTGKSVATVNAKKGEIVFTVKCEGIKTYKVNGFKVGDKIVSAGDFVKNTEITAITSEPSDSVFANSSGKPVLSKNPLVSDFNITIKASTDANAPILKVGIQEVAVGKLFIVKTAKGEINGIVESIQ